MRLIGVGVGILAALVVLLSWVEEPAQEDRLLVVDTQQRLATQGEDGHPPGRGNSVVEADVESPPPSGAGEAAPGAQDLLSAADQGALMDTAAPPRRPADPGVLEAPSTGAQGADLPHQPIADKVASRDPVPDSGLDTGPGEDPGIASSPAPSPMEPMAGAQLPPRVAEPSPDSVLGVTPINGPPSTADLLSEAPVPASGLPIESGPDADAGPDSSSTAQQQAAPPTDPTLQWHLFMGSFGSAYKAEGFADYLSRTTGIPMTMVQEGVGKYRVALGYHDAMELRERIAIIEASTGLDAKGDRR